MHSYAQSKANTKSALPKAAAEKNNFLANKKQQTFQARLIIQW